MRVHIGTLLCVTSGFVLGPEGIPGLGNILRHLEGLAETPDKREWFRLSDKHTNSLNAKFAFLPDATKRVAKSKSSDERSNILKMLILQYGEWHEI